MCYDLCDYGHGCDAAATGEAHDYGFRSDALASESALDSGQQPRGADGGSDSTEIAEDGLYFPPTVSRLSSSSMSFGLHGSAPVT